MLRDAVKDEKFATAVDIIRQIALTGCRRSEMIRLKWTEADTEASCLRLEDSKEGDSIRPIGLPVVEYPAGSNWKDWANSSRSHRPAGSRVVEVCQCRKNSIGAILMGRGRRSWPLPQIDDLRVFQRERQKHVRPCNNVHRRYVATHSNADAARQAGAAEHQVVLGRLARRTTDSDGLSSLVIPQRNPLPGDESVQRAPRQPGGLAPPSSASAAVSKPTRGCSLEFLLARLKMVSTLIAQMSDLLPPISKSKTRA
jgi:hypothetical protein